MSKTVLVPVADGTEELEAVTLIDVLRRAGAAVTVASVGGIQVTGSRGTKLVADCLIGDCRGSVYDLIVLPGGMPGSEHLRDSPELTEMLKEQMREGRYYAAICAAPVVVLKRHGLLGQRRATCHSIMAAKLDNRQAVEQSVVADGTCITSRGPRTAMEFALKLIEVLFGMAKAEQVKNAMV